MVNPTTNVNRIVGASVNASLHSKLNPNIHIYSNSHDLLRNYHSWKSISYSTGAMNRIKRCNSISRPLLEYSKNRLKTPILSHRNDIQCELQKLIYDLRYNQIAGRNFSTTSFDSQASSFKRASESEASEIRDSTETELREKLLSLNSFMDMKQSSKESLAYTSDSINDTTAIKSSNRKSNSKTIISFSSLQYESTVQSLKEQALQGNIENMLIIYNFLYNHGDCRYDKDKHAQLLRFVFLGYFHSGKFEHLIQFLLQCFEWKSKKPEIETFSQKVNQEFEQLIRSLIKISPESDAFKLKKFFHCQNERAPMHTHIIELLFDALAEFSTVQKMRSLLDFITKVSPNYLQLNMTSIYNSFLRSLILKKEYKKAQEFFNAHFISKLNPNSDQLLGNTNNATKSKESDTFWNLENENDFRIHPNNFEIAEPDLYSYSMLITAHIMNGDLFPALTITETLFESKFYNVVTATQALLIQSFLHRNGKASITDVENTWNKYFEYNKKLERKNETIEVSNNENGHKKCIPDSRAVSVYIISLLQASKHDETLKLLKTYSDIYVPDPTSLELLIVSLFLHASKNQRLDFLDSAIILYNRYINTTTNLPHRIKMPISFFEQIFSLSRLFLGTNAKNSITTFVETLLKDCFNYYKLSQISNSLVKAAESLNLGFLLKKSSDEKDLTYKIPTEITSGLPKDLQIFPGIREREHAFSVKDFASIISLGPLDSESSSVQEDQLRNIIRLHIQDPKIGNLLFHYNENNPPSNGNYYSIICCVKSIGGKEDYLISIPWTVKMVELGILKLKDASLSNYLKNAIEKWADFELVWASLDSKRTVFPSTTNLNINPKQLQILARCIRSGESFTSQIQEVEQQLANHGLSFENQKDLIQATSLFRCVVQQEIDENIRTILKDSKLTPEEQDQKIIQSLGKYCPDSAQLIHQAQIMRGILNPEIVTDILFKSICLPTTVIEQNKEAKRLFYEHRIQIPQPISERMKIEREKANILNPKHCPVEIRQSIFNECVMLVMSKQEQNDEAMRILCDLGYALPRTKIELEMRKARDQFMKKKVRVPGSIIPGIL